MRIAGGGAPSVLGLRGSRGQQRKQPGTDDRLAQPAARGHGIAHVDTLWHACITSPWPLSGVGMFQDVAQQGLLRVRPFYTRRPYYSRRCASGSTSLQQHRLLCECSKPGCSQRGSAHAHAKDGVLACFRLRLPAVAFIIATIERSVADIARSVIYTAARSHVTTL